MKPLMNRRHLLRAAVAAPYIHSQTGHAQPRPTLGQGSHRYRVVPGWGVLDDKTPVKNCHGIVEDAEGHIVLLTDHTANNVIVYNKAGKLVHKWGTQFPGAHGLSIVNEGARQVLFLTDLVKHKVVKTTLDGKVLDEWLWPELTGKYDNADQYRPSWTLHLANGDFFVLDGYGRDYILRYSAKGQFQKVFGGRRGALPIGVRMVAWPTCGMRGGGLRF